MIWPIFLFLHIFALNANARAKGPNIDNVVRRCAQYGFYSYGSNQSFLDWQEWLKEIKVEDSTGLFEKLSQEPKYNDFVYHNMHMAFSRSAQKLAATPEHPRLITYHPMGVVLGMVETPVKTQELMNKQFEGIRYNFENDQWEPFKGFIEQTGVRLSQAKKNTVSCLACHGQTFRPIWRSYSAWPGQVSDFEVQYIDKLNNLAHGQDTNPGQSLMEFLNRFNYRRMLVRLKENPNWPLLKPATTAALLGCPKIPNFLGNQGSPLRTQLDGSDSQKFPKLADEVATHISRLYEEERAFAQSINDKIALKNLVQENEIEDAPRMAALRYLFESSGTDIKNFSMSRPPGPDTFGYGFNQIGTEMGGVQNFLCYVLPDYVNGGGTSNLISQWKPLDRIESYHQVCRDLELESLSLTENGNKLLVGIKGENADIVTFEVPKGTGKSPWNFQEKPIKAKVGQTIRFKNSDDVMHQLHTNGAPCNHGSEIQPGGSWDCVTSKPYDSMNQKDGPLWDHPHGLDSHVWIVVSPD